MADLNKTLDRDATFIFRSLLLASQADKISLKLNIHLGCVAIAAIARARNSQ